MEEEVKNQGKIAKKNFSLGQKLLWWLSAQGLKIFVLFILIFPKRFLPKLGDYLGALGCCVWATRRKTALENIKMVFGSKLSEAETKSLTKANFKHISRDMFEVLRCHISRNPQDFLETNISIEGKEHLDSALKKGKGVIAVSVHIGIFPLIAAKMPALGYPFWLVYKDPNNIYLINIFKQWMHRLGMRMVPYKPRRVCVSESLKVLRNNGIIFLLIDQNPSRRYGTNVEFFDYQVPTYSGPIVMAQRTGAAVVPMFIHRNENNTSTINIMPEIPLKKSSDKEKDLIDNLRAINAVCEEWVGKYPEQWWWVHRRFRWAKQNTFLEAVGNNS